MSDTKKLNLLITGGAGFIGSNLVEHFLKDERVGLVRVLDDLSNGHYRNIEEFIGHPRFEFIEGDICDYDTCLKACEGIHKISHQAALGSVPRSIENPMLTNEVNVGGTVNVLHAAKTQGVERVILAFSSSTYGDHPDLPKVEGKEGKPLSPYAVSKAAIEQYADVFGKTYGLNWIGLRYFNVFGPKQDPNGAYAAVIPLFVKQLMQHQSPVINGLGDYSRDFTYIDNVIQMNERAMFTTRPEALNTVYNTAVGDRTTLNDLVNYLKKHLSEFDAAIEKVEIKYGPQRQGDVPHSLASIEKAKSFLGYSPTHKLENGLKEAVAWYWENMN
jgi:UDP-N-acetylglucosamine 4-epimerase